LNALSGEPPLRMGNDGQGSAPSGLFACRGGEVLLQAGKDPDFVKLCRILGLDHLAQDPRFAARANRVENYAELQPTLIETIAKWDRDAFYEALVEAGVICGPVNRVDQGLVDPQVIASGIEKPAGHPDSPDLKLIGSPIRFSDEVEPIRRYPPRVGEHSEEVLREVLGLDAASIAGLAEKRVIQLF
jgi:crotonobetainyl-CoA:carnitine CoA-transferase CaiB-like acyl-CoA transferase